jgi:hypothetical protein
MARKVRYTYKGKTKEILFSFREFVGPHEAAAAEEGVDISGYHDMLTQVEMASTSLKAVKDFRHNYFAKLGFDNIGFVKAEKK